MKTLKKAMYLRLLKSAHERGDEERVKILENKQKTLL